jgi:6-phosphogluconate dehydrogenase (decarboxylating)
MQLGMIRLGLLGANMVRRLMKDGHDRASLSRDPLVTAPD